MCCADTSGRSVGARRCNTTLGRHSLPPPPVSAAVTLSIVWIIFPSGHLRVNLSTRAHSYIRGVLSKGEGGCWRVLCTPACPGQALYYRRLVTGTLDTHPYVYSRYITVKVNNQPISRRLKHLPRNATQTPSPEMLQRRGEALLAAPCLRHILTTIQGPDDVQFDSFTARNGTLGSKHLLRMN